MLLSKESDSKFYYCYCWCFCWIQMTGQNQEISTNMEQKIWRLFSSIC